MGELADAKALGEQLVAELKALAKNASGGALQVSCFKFNHVRKAHPRNSLGVLMWDHLKGKVPQDVLEAVDAATEEAIETLVIQGVVTRGGSVKNHTFGPQDHIVLTRTGAKKVLGEAPLFAVPSTDGSVFKERTFHPTLVAVAEKLFADGHYGSAILEGCKAIVAEVRKKGNLSEDGAALMTKAFSAKSPVLRLNGLSTDSERDEQLGFMQIFQGTMTGIRNPNAHEIADQKDRARALEYLGLLSLLLRRVDDSQV